MTGASSTGTTPTLKQKLDRARAEVELAVAVTEAVQVFGDEQSASEELDMPVEAIRRFLGMAQAEVVSADNVAEVPGRS
jgi:hypothetical protein